MITLSVWRPAWFSLERSHASNFKVYANFIWIQLHTWIMYVCLPAGLCHPDCMVETWWKFQDKQHASWGKGPWSGIWRRDTYGEMEGSRGFLDELNKETKASEAWITIAVSQTLTPSSEFQSFWSWDDWFSMGREGRAFNGDSLWRRVFHNLWTMDSLKKHICQQPQRKVWVQIICKVVQQMDI